MKRKDFIKYLEINECFLKRHGGNHDLYINIKNGKTSTVPRHKEINNELCKKICKDIGISMPDKK